MSEMPPLEKLVEQTKQNPLERENWIALGKALGWEEYTYVDSGNWDEVSKMTTYSIPTLKFKAHKYFDLVLTNGDTEKFWLDLLNPKRNL